MAIEEHRALLRLKPNTPDSLHARFRRWEMQRQVDKAFCAAGALIYLKSANEAETVLYTECKNRLPLETHYYEVYNQPNVRLVDINETPIERITPISRVRSITFMLIVPVRPMLPTTAVSKAMISKNVIKTSRLSMAVCIDE